LAKDFIVDLDGDGLLDIVRVYNRKKGRKKTKVANVKFGTSKMKRKKKKREKGGKKKSAKKKTTSKRKSKKENAKAMTTTKKNTEKTQASKLKPTYENLKKEIIKYIEQEGGKIYFIDAMHRMSWEIKKKFWGRATSRVWWALKKMVDEGELINKNEYFYLPKYYKKHYKTK